jgi:hypothetical protein
MTALLAGLTLGDCSRCPALLSMYAIKKQKSTSNTPKSTIGSITIPSLLSDGISVTGDCVTISRNIILW